MSFYVKISFALIDKKGT